MAANSDERNRPDDDPVYEAWRSVGQGADVEQDVDESQTNEPEQETTGSVGSDSQHGLADAVHRNTELLQQLIERLESQVSEAAALDYTADESELHFEADPFAVASDDAIEAVDENIRLRAEIDQLREEIDRLEKEIGELRIANKELSSNAGDSGEEPGVKESKPAPEMDWEERKRQILAELENDSFDAESFLTAMNEDIESEKALVDAFETPAEYVEALNAELTNLNERLRREEKENQELRTRLEAASVQASDSCPPAADIPVDEQVQLERDKFARMQADWEERFREAEIEASMERAKISRERRMMELKNQALEEQVEALRVYEKGLTSGEVKETGGSRRKWMAKLGISEDE